MFIYANTRAWRIEWSQASSLADLTGLGFKVWPNDDNPDDLQSIHRWTARQWQSGLCTGNFTKAANRPLFWNIEYYVGMNKLLHAFNSVFYVRIRTHGAYYSKLKQRFNCFMYISFSLDLTEIGSARTSNSSGFVGKSQLILATGLQQDRVCVIRNSHQTLLMRRIAVLMILHLS